MKTFCVTMMLLLPLLVGCASTQSRIDSRIGKNPTAFHSATPEARKAIREGKVSVGFTKEQVEMAWGRPSRKVAEQSSDGAKELWIYTTTRTSTAYIDPHSNYRFGLPSTRRTSTSSRIRLNESVPPVVRFNRRVERARVLFSGDTVEKVQANKEIR